MSIPEINWSELPSDPVPAPWVRPWQWLQMVREVGDTEGLRSYLAEAERNGLPAVFGITPTSRKGNQHLPVPRDMVIEEWLGQSIYLPAGSSWLRLTGSNTPQGEPVLQRPVAFVSCSLPPAAESARETPAGFTVGALEAAARWTDRLLVTEPGRGRNRARCSEQPFVLVWEPGPGQGQLQVIDVESGVVVASRAARLTRAVRACPLIRGAVPGQLCRMYGGPWVSASIVAAGKWLRERWVRLQDVGCDTCGDGEVRLGPGKVPPLGSHYDVKLTGDGSYADQARCYGPAPCRYSEIVPARR